VALQRAERRAAAIRRSAAAALSQCSAPRDFWHRGSFNSPRQQQSTHIYPQSLNHNNNNNNNKQSNSDNKTISTSLGESNH